MAELMTRVSCMEHRSNRIEKLSPATPTDSWFLTDVQSR